MPSGVPNGRRIRSIEAAAMARRRAPGRCRRSGKPIKMWPAPQSIAMTARVMNIPAVSPAATCAPPFSDAASDTAPMPSASVDRPTIAVSAPQTTNRMATKATCDGTRSHERRLDGDTDVHTHRAGVRRRQTKTKGDAVADAWRHSKTDGVMKDRFAGPGTAQAWLGPRLAAAAATWARAADRHDEWRDQAVERLARRQRQLGLEQIVRRGFAEKRVAHPLDHTSGGRKVDRDLVGEALVGHARTIGAQSHDVKVVLVCSRVYGDERMSALRIDDAVERVDGDDSHSG